MDKDEYIKLKTYVDIDTVDDWYYAAAGPAMAILQELLPTITFFRRGDEVLCDCGYVEMEYDPYSMKATVMWRAELYEWQDHRKVVAERQLKQIKSSLNGWGSGRG